MKILLIICLLIIFIGAISIAFSSKEKKLNSVQAKNIGNGQHGNSMFLSQKQFEEEFTVEDQGRNKRGIILGYTQNNNFILDDSDKNIQLIGPPGTGKSKSFYEPNLAYNLDVHKNTGDGYNIFTIDLKGDQTNKFAQLYKDNGYNVTVINFRNPFNSEGYNPLDIINFYMDKALKYSENDKEYILNYSKSEKYSKILSDSITSSSEGQSESSSSEYFTTTSSGLLTGIILIVSEYGKTMEERTLISVFELLMEANQYDIDDSEIQKSKLVALLDGIKKRRVRAKFHTSAATAADAKTSMNIFSSALQKMLSFMTQETEQILIRSNEILGNLKDYVNKPTIIFLILPDEDETKDFFASLITKTLYNNLIEIAHDNYNGVLPRQWLALEDEAGNFPAIKKKDRIITAVRSRNIKVISAYQNDHQIKRVYGDKIADVIEAGYQTVLTASLSPKDVKGKENMSKRLGKKTILSASTTSGTSSQMSSISSTTSSSTTYTMMGKNIMEIDEITKLKVGEWIIEKVNLPNPIKTKLKVVDEFWNIKETEYSIFVELKTIYPLNFEVLKYRFKEPFVSNNQYLNEYDYSKLLDI